MEQMSHRFAAILAADVAHYSRLIERDSEGTIRALKECRGIFQRCVTSHDGREFGSVGDSLMAEFPSPVEALRAARDIHTQLASLMPIGGEGRLRVRIGLHAGDVICDGENLFGDVVNAASRLQSIAQPGGIALSGFVYTQVRTESGFQFRSLGQQSLKNIAEPIVVYEVERQHRRFNWRRLKLAILPYRLAIAVTLGVIGAGVAFIVYFEVREQPGIGGVIEIPADNSIAVLPFQIQGTDESDFFLAAGIHADVLNQLAKIKAFDKVISRASMAQYRDTIKPVPVIAAELKVATILVGGVQRIGDQVRINVELIDAASDSHLWADSYDRELSYEDIFAIQSEIARSVARALQLVVTADESDRLSAMPTHSLDAYREYVRGQQEMSRITVESMRNAIMYFNSAIALDPGYADAYLGLAEAFSLQRWYLFDNAAADTTDQQRAAVDRALKLNPNSGEAIVALAMLHANSGEWEQAERHFLDAIELVPNSAGGHLWYSVVLRNLGRLDEALEHSKKALELVPNPPPVFKMNVARQLFHFGEEEEAQALLLESVKADPEFVHYYFDMARLLYNMEKPGEALRWAKEAVRIDPSHRHSHFWTCFISLHLGDGVATEQCAKSYEAKFSQQLVAQWVSALILQSKVDEVIEFVERLENQENLSPQDSLLVGASWAVLDRPLRARPIWESLGPEFFGDAEVEITRDNATLALHIGCALYRDGRIDRANDLMDRGMKVLRSNYDPNSFITVFAIGTRICRNDKPGATSALRKAVDNGWRYGWHQLRFPAFVNSMGDDPEWQRLTAKIEDEIVAQRQWYEEHKDEPLF
jgi:class 3 adenylate cyclase/TolB-like protein